MKLQLVESYAGEFEELADRDELFDKAVTAAVMAVERVGSEMLYKRGPFIGPRGGKWADPQHKIPWHETRQGLWHDPSSQAHHDEIKATIEKWSQTENADAREVLRRMEKDWASADHQHTILRGADGQPIALAMHFPHFNRDGGVHLDYLVSRPAEHGRARGAGTQAIAAIIQHSIEAGGTGAITLDALPGAVPFYEHLGFTMTKRKGAMELSAEAARALLGRLGLRKATDPWLETAYDLETAAGPALATKRLPPEPETE